MSIPRDQPVSEAEITVNDDVIAYIKERNCDFRICTSCGGPVLLPVTARPPKTSDLQIHLGGQVIYVSIYQARDLQTIHAGLIPSSFFRQEPDWF